MQIAQQHGGTTEVHSRAGRTQMRVLLPIVEIDGVSLEVAKEALRLAPRNFRYKQEPLSVRIMKKKL